MDSEGLARVKPQSEAIELLLPMFSIKGVDLSNLNRIVEFVKCKHIDWQFREITFKIIDRIIGINLEYGSKTGPPLTISRVSKVLLSGLFFIDGSTKKFHAALLMFLQCKENLRLENERHSLFLCK